MKRKSRKKVAFRGKRQNRFGMFLVSAVVLMLLAGISVNSYTLKQKQQEYLSTEAALDAQIAEEEKALEAEKLSQEKALAKAKKAGKVRDLGTQYPGDAN